jgi:NADH-quinone oxidoreductase subunit E
MAETDEKIDLSEIVERWKEKKGSLIMVLHGIQNRYGYVPRSVAKELSELMDIPLARIYEVITFYNYFKLNPPGKYTISVCQGTACYLKGADMLVDEIKKTLGINVDETTDDGLFHLEEVRCLGCCGLAPVVKINDRTYGNLKPDEIPEILSEYMGGE